MSTEATNTVKFAEDPVTLTTTVDTATLTENLNVLTNGNTITVPSWTSPYYISTSTYIPQPLLTVEKAENGFIVKKGYKTYIAKTAKEVLKYLQEDKRTK